MAIEEDLRRLIDERSIERLMLLYCRGADRGDRQLLTSVFWSDAVFDHGGWTGTPEAFAELVARVMQAFAGCAHTISNMIVDVEGDEAALEAYFTVWHRFPAGDVTRDPYVKEAIEAVFSSHDTSVDEDLFVGGRYLKRASRREGCWRFTSHQVVLEWARWETATDRDGVVSASSARADRGDPLYSNLLNS